MFKHKNKISTEQHMDAKGLLAVRSISIDINFISITEQIEKYRIQSRYRQPALVFEMLSKTTTFLNDFKCSALLM